MRRLPLRHWCFVLVASAVHDPLPSEGLRRLPLPSHAIVVVKLVREAEVLDFGGLGERGFVAITESGTAGFRQHMYRRYK